MPQPVDLTPLESRLGHAFADRGLAEEAITHSSYYEGLGEEAHYQRLEFLGDAVLGLAAAEFFFRRDPDGSEGELSKGKAEFISEPRLAAWAQEIALGEIVRLGTGEERAGGRTKVSLLADVVEALFGAVFLDAGFERARDVVGRYLEWSVQRPADPLAVDAKTLLQELVQARRWDLPRYAVVEESGPDHAKTFVVEVWIRGESGGRGEGRSKKTAEQAAAAAALEILRSEPA